MKKLLILMLLTVLTVTNFLNAQEIWYYGEGFDNTGKFAAVYGDFQVPQYEESPVFMIATTDNTYRIAIIDPIYPAITDDNIIIWFGSSGHMYNYNISIHKDVYDLKFNNMESLVKFICKLKTHYYMTVELGKYPNTRTMKFSLRKAVEAINYTLQ